ncbi:hypothetical protein HBI56_182320 [Parastagonospora nodorum]|uniref:Uncharacterized protein n=1 Tax=Phaeosphaeria nodorum (strain SN15 / ATCC MYA-4574 / FGSC 10173) TaxID=321614 RepID=A0A7U2F900_PHANO|nr:hypothetical protein HBH56_187730 [Parastagonospora nodorum]QRD00944.1 hypothetical protein JI435_164770 [Parastagonospora nodorum SN15]KAH3925409.1 hypothetical protein HBH54_180830 [Parastagonospora nodorum]KAH3959128.1 hypothetical protein HBH52_246250 [Parastagonospora nodorum]KAH3991058.1 hypothetical protein HBI10_238990 [Parastagonospora nodorum]
MSLFDIFLKRGQQNFRKKNHYRKRELRDVDDNMGLFKSSVPPPLIRQEDGSMIPPGGGHSFHRVDAPHRRSRHSRGVQSNHPGSMMLDKAKEAFVDGDGGPSHRLGRTGQRGSSRHFSQHHAEPSYHYGHTGQREPSYHLGYSNQHGQHPLGGMSQPRHDFQHWSQQANPSGQVGQRDWANPASGDPALSKLPFEQPYQHSQRARSPHQPRQLHQPSQRAPPNQQPQHQAPAPRPGKFREGDRLPAGVIDPLATVSPNYPLGHHGMRQHVAGMTQMNPERHGKADDPMANFKVLEDMAALGDKRHSKRR